jgi:hypothetical protein
VTHAEALERAQDHQRGVCDLHRGVPGSKPIGDHVTVDSAKERDRQLVAGCPRVLLSHVRHGRRANLL